MNKKIFRSCIKISVSFLILISFLLSAYSQSSHSNQLILSHPLNYSPAKKLQNYYSNQMFSFGVPDTLNVYAIMVQFQQDNNPNTTGDGRYDLSNNYPDSVDAPPHDSAYFANHMEFLNNYYYQSSKGRLVVNFRLIGGVRTLSKTMDQYSAPTEL